MQQNGGSFETIFTMEATPVKYGPGSSEETGWEVKRFGLKRVMLVSDPNVVASGITPRIRELIEAEGVEVEMWDKSRVEPTSDSFQAAADFAKDGNFDGFVAVGGGSSMDTAKIASLIATHGGEIMDYVNPPIGGGKKPPGPTKPLICVPTTAGTGSEATTAAILDIPDMKVKTGISHTYLRPNRGIVDPLLTMTAPSEVMSSAGLDVVCHAAESYLTKPYNERPKIDDPDERPPYQGANPVADMWSAKALEYGGKYLRRAVADGKDVEARGFMMLGATLAGVGFGSAGVHIPHACAYPIAGLKHEWQPPGYPENHPFVPHGWSVIVTSPAAFRFTYDAMPERHHEVANLLAGEKIENPDEDTLPRVLIDLMRDIGAPGGVRELGYSEDDIPALVEGAMKQERLLVGVPKEVDEEDLANIIRDSMENW
ncbi:MAG: iron-containing alcohol dehydrogenase [Actinomycetota bacterium]|jgi:alcohol dehydrogenase class IV|nr:iron-containing alcohol dehydrogenase [Rubrobacter sp.]MDQ3507948.1 iron-containing alcohol dehydrogenase [Actinomycetota bacterium]